MDQGVYLGTSRRQFVRAGSCLLCSAGLFAVSSSAVFAQTTNPAGYKVPKRFERPPLEGTEGGLWAMMDREEQRARRSPFLIKDAKFQSYVESIVQQLAGPHRDDIRLHILRVPFFNAAMAPNGMMLLWSGLLLRIENEAQLAAVIGHELGHYFERHTLKVLENAKSTSAAMSVLSLLGIGGLIGSLLLAGAFAGFSRDQEREADQIGLQLMADAGLDPNEAALVWRNLIEELEAGGKTRQLSANPLTASHPAPSERLENLAESAKLFSKGTPGADRWFEHIKPMRLGWILDEIKRAQYAESLVLFDRLLKLPRSQPEIHFGRGETLRLRAQGGDIESAMSSFRTAIQLGSPPLETYRSIGLIHMNAGQKQEATEAFKQYLAGNDNAADAELIKSYIEELKV